MRLSITSRFESGAYSSKLSRRRFLRVLVTVLGGAGLLKELLIPSTVKAQVAALGMPQPDELVDATLKRLFGNRVFQRGDDKLKLDLPQIAEDGGSVAITIDSSLPVSGAVQVSHIYIISDKNRRPMLAKFSFTPESGRAFGRHQHALGDHHGCARGRGDERWYALCGEQACAGDHQRL